MKLINKLVVALSLLLLHACATPIIDLTGDVSGVVKDYSLGHFLANCQVTLNPTGKSTTTSPSGAYEFTDLEAGEYILSFSKQGYEEASTKVAVVAGQTTEASILLKAKAAFSVSETSLNFGDLKDNISFYVTNNTDSDCSYEVSNVPSWLTVTPSNGILSASSTGNIVLKVNRDAVDYGSYTHSIALNYTGRTSGAVNIEVRFEKVQLSTPTVSCSSSAENVEETSFTIGGKVEATGGSTITEYGHCWSVKQYPTIEDDCSKFGSSTSAMSFSTSLTDLMSNTTYYVRAYATNAQGTAYSEQVLVTTKDVYSEKWDGSIAASFAGGSGKSGDPLIIKTGAQLMLMKDYPSYEYKLANNIDLDNHNWKPFPFYGKLNGDGYVISNLRIERDEDYLGLFSYLSETYMSDTYGEVKNLTIKGVYINAPSSHGVGAIVGRMNVAKGEPIINCKVIFTENSMIKGASNVGGIAGYNNHFANTNNLLISYCTVESMTDEPVIFGNSKVGGIVGSGTCSSCTAKVSISGGTIIGGVCGQQEWAMSDCFFEGEISGDTYIGGIAGTGSGKITRSKAVASIYATDDYAGGLVGGGYAEVYSCYADGNIECQYTHVKNVGGLVTDKAYVYHSYSTVTSNNPNFDGIGSGTSYLKVSESCTSQKTKYAKSQCTDIATYMKECYSKYADHWNYTNTWDCHTEVDGESKVIPCPKLSWEQ